METHPTTDRTGDWTGRLLWGEPLVTQYILTTLLATDQNENKIWQAEKGEGTTISWRYLQVQHDSVPGRKVDNHSIFRKKNKFRINNVPLSSASNS